MTAANSLPKSPTSKPPPLPKSRGFAVVQLPALPRDTMPETEVTSVDLEIPHRAAVTVESDVRELRPSRPPPPRPSAVPRPGTGPASSAAAAKKSMPPPLPAPTAPESDVEGPLPERSIAAVVGPATVPAHRPVPQIRSPNLDRDMAAMKPGALVGLRTAWFFGAFVTAGAFRGVVRVFAAGGAWLAAEWRHAGRRARGLPPG